MRVIVLSLLLGLTLATVSLAQSQPADSLIRLETPVAEVDSKTLPGITPIAHLTVPEGDYLLALATPPGLAQLDQRAWTYALLDPAADGAYYLVENSGSAQEAGQAYLDWLHIDSRYLVGRLSDSASERDLESLPVPFQALGSEPIELQAPQSGRIPVDPVHDSLVEDLLQEIDTGTVYQLTGDLSGEWPVDIGGLPYVLTTRYSYSVEPIAKATQFVSERMAALGYDTDYHYFNLSGYSLRNVIGEKIGQVHPEQVVLLTAHLDSRAATWPHNPAPGADDNASGSAALLAAAELLADTEFDYTVRFVFFTGEEQGMWGSYYYAADVAQAGEDIVGVLNVDMIGWDAVGGPQIDLHSHTSSVQDDSDALADLFAALIDVYALGLEPQIVENGARFSDHSRFWDQGYAAVMAIEDYYNLYEQPAEPRDWNTNYHSVGDRLDTLNLSYLSDYVKASIATLVHVARPMRKLGGRALSADAGQPLAVAIQATGERGTFTSNSGPDGLFSLDLPSGDYVVTITADGYLPASTDVVLLSGTGLWLDIVLHPAITFSLYGTLIDAYSGSPLTGTIQIDQEPPITVHSGIYSTTIAAGDHQVLAAANHYQPLTTDVTINGDMELDLALTPYPCLLVVDDDFDNLGNGYDDQAYYTAALDELGIDYDVWTVPDDVDGPPSYLLNSYRGIVWLTGRDWDYTLTANDQSNLSVYLDGGGRLFVSGQDIGWDIARNGAPPFYLDYLHAIYLRDDSSWHELTGAEFMAGLPLSIQGGDGANNQEYPSDIAVATGGTGIYQYSNDGDWAGTAYSGDNYRTVYFAFGFEAIDSSGDRLAVMESVLDYLAACPSDPPEDPIFDFTVGSAPLRYGRPGQSVDHYVAIANSGNQPDAYDFSVEPGSWVASLPLTRSLAVGAGSSYDLPVTVTVPPGAPAGASDELTLTVSSVGDPALSISLELVTAVGYHSYLPLLILGPAGIDPPPPVAAP